MTFSLECCRVDLYTLRLTEQTNTFVAASADRPTVQCTLSVQAIFWFSCQYCFDCHEWRRWCSWEHEVDLEVFQSYLVDQIGNLWWSSQRSIWRSIARLPQRDGVRHLQWSIWWANWWATHSDSLDWLAILGGPIIVVSIVGFFWDCLMVSPCRWTIPKGISGGPFLVGYHQW